MSESSGSLIPPKGFRKLISPERVQSWEDWFSAEGLRRTDSRTDFFDWWALLDFEGRAYGEERLFLLARRSFRLTALIVNNK